MIDLFAYTDYRAYLRDFYEGKKKKFHFFSYRFLSDKIGIDPGNLFKIIQGTRHLSSSGVKRFIAYANFTGRESAYFSTLVRFGKAKRAQENKLLFEKLMALQRVDPVRLAPQQYEFYSQWYHTAVLALLSFVDFNGDYERLAAMTVPRITVEQARRSVALLQKLGLLRAEKNGKLTLTNAILTTGEQWRSIAIHAFQEQCIRLAQEALNTIQAPRRDLSTVTIAVSKNDLDEIKRVTSEYRKTVLHIASASEKPDRVYQLNIQLFPLSDFHETGGRDET